MRAHPRPPGFCRKIFGAKSANPRIGDFSPQIEENMIMTNQGHIMTP